MIKNFINWLENFLCKKCIHTPYEYILDDNEESLWNSIQQKAKDGYNEWKDRENFCGPCWIKALNKEEKELLHKIHEELFGNVIINDPIGCSQIDYMMYIDVEYYVIKKSKNNK